MACAMLLYMHLIGVIFSEGILLSQFLGRYLSIETRGLQFDLLSVQVPAFSTQRSLTKWEINNNSFLSHLEDFT